MSAQASSPLKSEIGFWLVLLAVAGIPLVFIAYYLNKGIRDLLSGPVSKSIEYVGGKIAETSRLADQVAYEWGYDSARDALAPRIAYDQQRSEYAKAHGYKYELASNPPGWPSYEAWLDGEKPVVP